MMIMEEKLVIDELKQGKELADRLKNNLKSSSSPEANRFLISQILCSYEKAISLLNFPAGKSKGIVGRSPRSGGCSDVDSKNVFKKRKITEKKTEQVKLCVGPSHDLGCLDDGYYWRKYGQKDILGSKNPRGYYRCTHRFSQGCLAVKQVQRSDTDPSVLEVKYVGSHTCNAVAATTKSRSEEHRVTEQNQLITETFEDFKPMKSEELTFDIDDLEGKKAIFRTFSIPRAEPETAVEKNGIFLENLMENVSPATSVSGVSCELMSAPTSSPNSPIGGAYFSSLENIIDIDDNFLFDFDLGLRS